MEPTQFRSLLESSLEICQWERAEDSQHIHTPLSHRLGHAVWEQEEKDYNQTSVWSAAALRWNPCCLQVTALHSERSSMRTKPHTAPAHTSSAAHAAVPSVILSTSLLLSTLLLFTPFMVSSVAVTNIFHFLKVMRRGNGSRWQAQWGPGRPGLAQSLTSSQGHLLCKWAKKLL